MRYWIKYFYTGKETTWETQAYMGR